MLLVTFFIEMRTCLAKSLCAVNLRPRINKRCRVNVMWQLNQCSAVKCFTFKCGCVIVVPHPVAPQQTLLR